MLFKDSKDKDKLMDMSRVPIYQRNFSVSYWLCSQEVPLPIKHRHTIGRLRHPGITGIILYNNIKIINKKLFEISSTKN